MKFRNLLFILIAGLLLIPFGCADLEVENLNDPNEEKLYANPADYYGLVGGLYKNWYVTVHEYEGPGLGLWVASDHGTCSWGNAGMNALSTEPRQPFNNTVSYADAAITRTFYSQLYGVLSPANTILKQMLINGKVPEVDAKLIEAFARLNQGLSLGYIGLTFDQAPIVDETTDLEAGAVPLSPYQDVIAAAIDKLDKCIEICNNNSFAVPAEWIKTTGLVIDNVKLGQMANTYAARLMVYGSRTKAQNDALDWSKVKAYAEKGFNEDLIINSDANDWYSLFQTYACFSGWGRVDMRVINMLDPNMPKRWPAGGYEAMPNGGVATSNDSRLATDFQFLATNTFRPDRGEYHFSSYRYSRFDPVVWPPTFPSPEMRGAENAMFLAEAQAMTNNLPAAINTINNSTYVTRGGLDPLPGSATKDQILAAIRYERTIELYLAGYGISFFDMRRKDELQKGTFLHLPIPAIQLDVMLVPNYTFGGVDKADGINTSNGGWN